MNVNLKLILDHFPLQSQQTNEEEIGEAERKLNQLILIQEASILQTPNSSIEYDKTKNFRPGAMYLRYRGLEDLTEEAINFYELAASKVGVSTNFLIRAVFQMEIQIESWLTANKKRELEKLRSFKTKCDKPSTALKSPQSTIFK